MKVNYEQKKHYTTETTVKKFIYKNFTVSHKLTFFSLQALDP